MTTSITTSITVGITYGPYVMADVENRTRNEITDAEFNFFVKNLSNTGLMPTYFDYKRLFNCGKILLLITCP